MSISNVFTAMAYSDINAQPTQMSDHRIFDEVGTRYTVTQIMEYLGNATHTDTANAGKMNITNAAHEVL
jgi:hypothetical protein